MTGYGRRVLVIEDDPDISRAVGIVLSRAGYEVTTVAEGPAGLRSFCEQQPAMVILDIELPLLDGWGVLHAIRDFSDIPVLMLTAHVLEADKLRGLRAGADGYLTKPFSNSELLARVEDLLRQVRSGC